MQEAWAYYFGETGISGRVYSVIAPEFSVCGAGNYIIFVGNAYRNNSTAGEQTNIANSPKMALEGTSNVGKNADPAATTLEKTQYAGSVSTQCGTASLPTASNSYELGGHYALNWANYLKRQGVTTYSVGVLGPTCNKDYAAHLTTLGQTDVGGGAPMPATTRSMRPPPPLPVSRRRGSSSPPMTHSARSTRRTRRFPRPIPGSSAARRPAVLNGILSLATPATLASPAGIYTITSHGQSSGNYAITYGDGRLTIQGSPVVTLPVFPREVVSQQAIGAQYTDPTVPSDALTALHYTFVDHDDAQDGKVAASVVRVIGSGIRLPN